INNLNKLSGSSSQSIEDILLYNHSTPKKENIYRNASLLYNLNFAINSLNSIVQSHPLTPNKQYNPFTSPDIPQLSSPDQLLETPSISIEISNPIQNMDLNAWIKTSFNSIHEFKTLLLNSAHAIKGDGFTWLVARQDNSQGKIFVDDLFVLNTYNSAQPNNVQSDYLSHLKKVYLKIQEAHESPLFSSIEEAKAKVRSVSKVSYIPLLAVDASPKAYLYDYGVFGKKVYLERLWNCIDWDVVASRMPK
ncbi:mitochondrial 37S ribosomal protein mS43, partial [Ascoidea rubescens DSM 1968]